MRRRLAALCFAILLASPTFAQNYVASPYLQPFVEVGYWYAPSDLNDYYSAVLDYYRQRGIPIPLQTQFGKTFSVEAGVVYGRIPEIQIGVSTGFRYTPAYSDYEDFAGVLKVDGAISTFSISLVVNAIVMNLRGQPIILTIEPGVIHSSAAITSEVRFTNMSQFNDKEEWDGHAWGYQFRLLLGTSVPVGPFIAGLHAGYQKGSANVTSGAVASAGWMISRYWPAPVDQEGMIILLRLGISI